MGKIYETQGDSRNNKKNPGGGEMFHTRPDRPWGPKNLLYYGYRFSSPGVKRPGRGINHPPPHLVSRLKKEKSYTSTPPLSVRGRL